MCEECIDVRGYLALFDVRESSNIYVINETLASQIVERNANNTIPVVVSHVDFRVDLTIGFVTELAVDNKGLFCAAIIDNANFLESQSAMNEDFGRYFTRVEPSPFLYLKSCLPCFSLSHNKHSLAIKHVALVDVGARRGTLVSYTYVKRQPSKAYTNRVSDFYRVLGCYSRNTLRLANQRNELLFQDALLCGETDTNFIVASLESEKTNINSAAEEMSRQTNTNMQTTDGMNDAISFISDLASVLNSRQQRGVAVKRSREDDEQSGDSKKRKVETGVVNGSQLVTSGEPSYDIQRELNNFRDEFKKMQSDLLASQTSMMRDILNERQTNGGGGPQYPVYGMQQPSYPMFQYLPPPSQSLPVKQQPTVQEAAAPTPLVLPEVELPMTEATEPALPETKTAESTLIEAGMSINESEHLINELFRQFIENTFTIKQA